MEARKIALSLRFKNKVNCNLKKLIVMTYFLFYLFMYMHISPRRLLANAKRPFRNLQGIVILHNAIIYHVLKLLLLLLHNGNIHLYFNIISL